MSCFISFEGTIQPKDHEAREKVFAILNREMVYYKEDETTPIIGISFSDECGWSMMDDLADEIAPLLTDGKITGHNEDSDGYFRYEFHNGKQIDREGTAFIYYDDCAEEFVNDLPEDVIEAVLKKYGGR